MAQAQKFVIASAPKWPTTNEYIYLSQFTLDRVRNLNQIKEKKKNHASKKIHASNYRHSELLASEILIHYRNLKINTRTSSKTGSGPPHIRTLGSRTHTRGSGPQEPGVCRRACAPQTSRRAGLTRYIQGAPSRARGPPARGGPRTSFCARALAAPGERAIFAATRARVWYTLPRRCVRTATARRESLEIIFRRVEGFFFLSAATRSECAHAKRVYR